MDQTILSSVLLLSMSTAVEAGPRPPAETGGGARLTKRVGGDLDVCTELKVDRYVCDESLVEAPLPDGYPPPTPPGAIELKRYPTVRRAEVSGDGDPDRNRRGSFWSLFNHIKKRDIAMTSPVEVDFRDDPTESRWTMSFLYRTPDLGPAGPAGSVTVVDTEPVTVVSVGARGPYGRATVDQGLEQLTAWLDSQSEWERAGEPRALYYNGPSIPNERKWAEIQIPVQPASTVVPGTADLATRPDASDRVLSTAQLIELAVQRGAPLFNNHQPQACAAIYEVTARWLLAASPSLDPDDRATLQAALHETARQDDARERAWTLRHALDDVYRSLSSSASGSRG
ncbi:MAG: heme-binding protein [Planctomycetota bacterium]|jgi:hypothetical protein